MNLIKEHVSRLGIYFFFDKEGIVDTYVEYMIQDLIKSLERLIVVCNGVLTKEGKRKFEKFTEEIIVRENSGLDVWAYKTAMDYVGWQKLMNYDEVILVNSTIMGPIYPFSEMFSEMDRRDLDFWGITKFGKMEDEKLKYSPYDYIPEHIQSHFMAYRKNFVSSIEFQKYWNNIPKIHSYDESVGRHESLFTKHFADMGYVWDVYVNTDAYEGVTSYPLNFYAKELIIDEKCPIFKRRSFFQPYNYVIANTVGQSAAELYRYLKDTGLYDVNMIWDNILRIYNQEDLLRCMQLNYIISSKYTDEKKTKEILSEKKLALVMHLYFSDLVKESKVYASYMPEETDIYITTDTPEKKQLIENTFSDLKCHHLEVRLIENRGRDVSSLLVGVADVIEEYDLACFVHDKKTTQIKPRSIGGGFAYKCFSNTLYNREFISNIVQLFDDNPRMGMLSPPMPNHGIFWMLYGNEWGPNFKSTKKLAEELKITVPMSEDKTAVAPYGTFFWFRPKAMKPLFEKKWEYKDFPQEPNKIDGTLLHAVERIYPFAVQQAGFYPGIIMSDDFAAIEHTNLSYYLREKGRAIEGKCEEIHEMYKTSTSWKISAPVRAIGEFIKGLRKRKSYNKTEVK